MEKKEIKPEVIELFGELIDEKLPKSPSTVHKHLNNNSINIFNYTKSLIDKYSEELNSNDVPPFLMDILMDIYEVIEKLDLSDIKEPDKREKYKKIKDMIHNKEKLDYKTFYEIFLIMLNGRKMSSKYNNIFYLLSIWIDLSSYTDNIAMIDVYRIIFQLSTTTYDYIVCNNNFDKKAIDEEDSFKKAQNKLMKYLNAYNKKLNGKLIYNVDPIRIYPYFCYYVMIVSAYMVSSKNKGLLSYYGVDITEDDIKRIKAICSNVMEIYRDKSSRSISLLSCLEKENNKLGQKKKLTQIDLQALWWIFNKHFEQEPNESSDCFKEYYNEIINERVSGIEKLLSKVQDIRKKLAQDDAIKKYYSNYKNNDFINFKKHQYIAFCCIMGLLAKRDYSKKDDYKYYVKQICEEYSIRHLMLNLLHSLKKELKKYEMEYYFDEIMKLINNTYNELFLKLESQ